MCCSNSALCPSKIFIFEDTVAKRAGAAKGNRSGFVEIFDILTLFFQFNLKLQKNERLKKTLIAYKTFFRFTQIKQKMKLILNYSIARSTKVHKDLG